VIHADIREMKDRTLYRHNREPKEQVSRYEKQATMPGPFWFLMPD
jgi:hypothetical protein